MEVTPLVPHSFCYGVAKAIELAEKAIEENKGKKVYLIGNLVHNEIVMDSLKEKGLIAISEKENDLYGFLKTLPPQSVIVFSAHGHSESFDEIANNKKFKIYDATCSFVKENLSFIKDAVKKNENTIYIGKKGHIECEAALSISHQKVELIDEKSGVYPTFPCDEMVNVICQTTLSLEEINKAKDYINSHYQKHNFVAQRCLATEIRQRSIEKVDDSCDLIVILGSQTSNNSLELYELAVRLFGKNKKVIMALDKNELEKFDLGGYKKASLASGASTAPKTFDEAYKYLLSI